MFYPFGQFLWDSPFPSGPPETAPEQPPIYRRGGGGRTCRFLGWRRNSLRPDLIFLGYRAGHPAETRADVSPAEVSPAEVVPEMRVPAVTVAGAGDDLVSRGRRRRRRRARDCGRGRGHLVVHAAWLRQLVPVEVPVAAAAPFAVAVAAEDTSTLTECPCTVVPTA